MYELSACIIVKNEALYLPEWIEFHLLQGVEHFYIYDDESTDDTFSVLLPYIKVGRVHYTKVTKIPGRNVQLAAYNHCIQNHRNDTEWCAFIDIDEFIHASQFKLVEALRLVSSDVACVLAHWYVFGSNGHKNKTEGLVIERFNKRATMPNPHVKSIARLSMSGGFTTNPHRLETREGRTVRAVNFEVLSKEPYLNENDVSIIPDSPVKIYHFHTKSAEEYKAKCAKGRADNGKERDFESNFRAHDSNEVTDITLRKYVNIIKSVLQTKVTA